MSDLTLTAIQAALNNDWENAILLNQQIVEQNPNDLHALNRLAFAYIQRDEIEKAKKIYRKIISLDRYNLIAKKNLEKINNLPKKIKHILWKNKTATFSPSLFIEEPGKTKTVALINIAPATNLYHLNIGDPVSLHLRRHSVEIRDHNKTYLGALPDDLAFKLLRFINAGNEYLAYIKNISKNTISVFIREAKRGKRFASQPSFITTIPKHSATVSHEEINEEEASDDRPLHPDEEV